MPDNSLYWYGNECTSITGGWSSEGWPATYYGLTLKEFERKTNYFYGEVNKQYVEISTNNLISLLSGQKLKSLGKASHINGCFKLFDAKGNPENRLVAVSYSTTLEIQEHSITSNANNYISLEQSGSVQRDITVYSVWLE